MKSLIRILLLLIIFGAASCKKESVLSQQEEMVVAFKFVCTSPILRTEGVSTIRVYVSPGDISNSAPLYEEELIGKKEIDITINLERKNLSQSVTILIPKLYFETTGSVYYTYLRNGVMQINGQAPIFYPGYYAQANVIGNTQFF